MHPSKKPLLACAGIAIGLLGQASAAILFFPAQDIPIPTTFAGVSVNLETGATSNDLGGSPGSDVNFFLGGEGISNDADENASSPTLQFVRTGINNDDPAQNLTFGAPVDSSQVYASDFGGSGGSVSHFPPFASGASGYVGFSVIQEDTTTAFGWMRVTLQNDNTPGVIHEWAIEQDGSPIDVGQTIPEPSHGLLLLLGLAGTLLRRRR